MLQSRLQRGFVQHGSGLRLMVGVRLSVGCNSGCRNVIISIPLGDGGTGAHSAGSIAVTVAVNIAAHCSRVRCF